MIRGYEKNELILDDETRIVVPDGCTIELRPSNNFVVWGQTKSGAVVAVTIYANSRRDLIEHSLAHLKTELAGYPARNRPINEERP
jgi:hypothetical protein